MAEPFVSSDALVLSNLNIAVVEINAFLEQFLGLTNMEVKTYSELPGKVLVKLGKHAHDIDFVSVVEKLTAVEEEAVIEISEPELFAAVISNQPCEAAADVLSEDDLKEFLCAQFYEDIVESCQMYQRGGNSFVAFIRFHEKTPQEWHKMCKELATMEQVPSASTNHKILVDLYYPQFHGWLENELKIGMIQPPTHLHDKEPKQAKDLHYVSNGQSGHLTRDLPNDGQASDLTRDLSNGSQSTNLTSDLPNSSQSTYLTSDLSNGSQSTYLTSDLSNGSQSTYLTSDLPNSSQSTYLTSDLSNGSQSTYLTSDLSNGSQSTYLTSDLPSSNQSPQLTSDLSNNNQPMTYKKGKSFSKKRKAMGDIAQLHLANNNSINHTDDSKVLEQANLTQADKLPKLDKSVSGSFITLSNDQPPCFEADSSRGSQSLFYQINNSCTLEIKNRGDITQEDSSILVNILDESADLSNTRVGRDFISICPHIRNCLEQAKAGNPEVQVLETVGPFTGLPLTCQVVYHAILCKYSPNLSDVYLSIIVNDLVQLATRAGYKSIAIPPLGCDPAHGYPASTVAPAVTRNLQTSVVGSSLTKVVLLSEDQRLMKVYKEEADKIFVPVSPKGQVADMGIASNLESGTSSSVLNTMTNGNPSTMPKCIARSGAPQRGTIDFVRHAAQCEEFCPSYWELYSKPVKHEVHGQRKKFLVDMDDSVLGQLAGFVYSLYDLIPEGHAQYASGLNHSDIEITRIQRVENPKLFKLYSAQRKLLFEKISEQGYPCHNISTLRHSSGPVATYENLPSFMKEELYHEVNEHYLFHGTNAMELIINNGPDFRVGNELSLYGRGFYMAEKASKSDQYTDKIPRTKCGTELTLILMRALLGNVFVCSKSYKGKKRLCRPPCMKCSKDICSCVPATLFDSVMAEGNVFREFIVYDKNCCYPEYVIFYKRVKSTK